MQSQPDLIQPAAEIAFTNQTSVQAAFGRDSNTLIVQSSENAINLFGLAVYFWPEIFGGLTFLLVAWTLLRWWRVARTPRLVGQPHCRRCNYCLTGLTQDRCPECGNPPSKRRPIIGRSLKRRAGPLLAVASVAALAYGALWAFQVPRIGFVNRLISICSPEWYEAARQRNATFLDRLILQLGGTTTRLEEYDAGSGKKRRLICRLRGQPLRDCLEVSRAHGVAWTILSTMPRLCAVSLADGGISREFPLPPELQSAGRWSQIAGISSDGKRAIAVIHDTAREKAVIMAADTSSGALTTLFEVDTVPSTLSSSGRAVPKFCLVPSAGPLRLIESRDGTIPSPDSPGGSRMGAVVLLHELHDNGKLVTCEFPPCFLMQAPAFSEDGRIMYMCTNFEIQRPVGWELRTFEPIGYQSIDFRGHQGWVRDQNQVPGADRSFGAVGRMYGNLAYCPVRRRHYSVLRDGERFRIGAYCEETDQWLEFFHYPFEVTPRDLRISADGRYMLVGAVVIPSGGNRGTYLLIYDLP